MTKAKTPTITIETPKTLAAATAAEELSAAATQLENAQQAALTGQMSGRDLKNVQADYDLAKLRSDAVHAAADRERKSLAPDPDIHTAITALMGDSALKADDLTAAFAQLDTALQNIREVNNKRNAAILGWVNKLRDLGVPDQGLTIGDEEVKIYTSATAGTTLTIGGNHISALRTPAAYVAHAVNPHTRDARSQLLDPATLTRLDQRDSERAHIVRVKLTRPLGGKPAGHILTSREINPTNLARTVRDGHAELIDGTLPEIPEQPARSLLPVGSDTTPSQGALTSRETAEKKRDDAAVTRAVEAAFS
ncbi:hypothetical protein [Microbacterium imperiale]|uniref:Uncharacterized protein n=1 Tax=Microbacterium imperiale TaxID=33884 RepID=A0A9W6HGK0_9MICO|nr:hypothetical protein [Microbacterium imperiale]MDS0200230.1 hypothetical protein [Microbacterium imperiale]BFE39382.1 hypothetical protein GCM10017544_03380 [Microbacterium imperiale]GLJ79751.1 hypothetical protein GCM10017586_14330 [Microbacterium imperiale]